MRLFFDQDQQVTVYTSMTGSISFTAHRQLHSFCNTSRNIDCNDVVITHDTFTVTFTTFLCDDLSFTPTSRTSRLRLHLPQDRIGNTCYYTTTMACITGFAAMIILSTTPVAFATRNIFLNLYLLFNSVSNLFQVQFYLHTQIRSTVHPAASTRTSSKTTETAKATEMSTKDVSELREDIFH